MTESWRDECEIKILEEALVHPKAALMVVAIEIERELRKLLVSTGALQRFLVLQSPTPPNALKILSSVPGASVPRELEEKISQFWSFRNSLVNSDNEVPLLALELGLGILRVLRNIPRPKYVVKKANVMLYSDKNCQVEREGVRGVLLETFDADGRLQRVAVYPSTREYVEGMSVGWEWNIPVAYRSEMGWGETWYKDPETNKCTLAWSESMEFIGKDVNIV